MATEVLLMADVSALGKAGEVVKVLVENGTPVEYGERLFAVRVG